MIDIESSVTLQSIACVIKPEIYNNNNNNNNNHLTAVCPGQPG